MNLENIAIEIRLAAIKEPQKIHAFASVRFLHVAASQAESSLTISGFMIMQNSYEQGRYKVVAPSVKGNDGKFHTIFFLSPATEWYLLEAKILEAYNQKINPSNPIII